MCSIASNTPKRRDRGRVSPSSQVPCAPSLAPHTSHAFSRLIFTLWWWCVFAFCAVQLVVCAAQFKTRSRVASHHRLKCHIIHTWYTHCSKTIYPLFFCVWVMLTTNRSWLYRCRPDWWWWAARPDLTTDQGGNFNTNKYYYWYYDCSKKHWAPIDCYRWCSKNAFIFSVSPVSCASSKGPLTRPAGEGGTIGLARRITRFAWTQNNICSSVTYTWNLVPQVYEVPGIVLI